MLRMRTLVQLVALIVVVLLTVPSSMASPAATSPSLGTADTFAILAGTPNITNVPTSDITGDVGLSPATGAGIGLTCPEVTGTIYSVDAAGPLPCRVTNPGLLTTAKSDLSSAYDALSAGANAACTVNYGAVTQELGGLPPLVPGVYCANDFTLSGILTLNGADTDVWIFRSAYTLITSGAAEVVLSTGGIPCEVWWKVGSSATLGTNTSLARNILALTSISLATGANLDGRALAQNGAVTLDDNRIAIPICPLAVPGITTQIHDANHVEVTAAPIGTIVHDMAQVTGTLGIPTGIVSFTVYANQTCAVPGTFAGAVPLNGAGVADPSNTAILTSAGLSYLAHYNGDANYDPADGPCEVLRPLGIPSVTTEIHDANHVEVIFAPIGTIVHDMAQVTGTLGIPTGIVSFTVYANPTCSVPGNSAGAVPLNAAGVADPSDTATLTSAGLSYLAHYNGDANYIPADGPCEVLVAPGMPHMTTQIHDANHVEVTFAPIGTIVHDMARVTGTLGIPTGIVSFTVYANPTCAVPGTFAGAVPLDAAGVADPSDTATLTSAGLSYLAHYSGDANYDPADGPCEVLVSTPTAVELLYFQASPLSGQQVQLKWATALEVDNFGFNVYRANVNDVLRASLIHFEPAVTQGSGSGATYVYIDTAPYAGPWWYWLSDVDTRGRETFHATPISINVQSSSLLYHVYCPFMVKGSGH